MASVLNIVSAKYATRWILRYYQHKSLIVHATHFNDNGNHVRLYEPKTGKRFHIKFARELFNYFYKLHPEFATGEEKGESINFEAVKDLGKDDMIFFARPEQIDMIFYEDLQKYGVIRTNDKEHIQTWSVGVSHLETIISTESM